MKCKFTNFEESLRDQFVCGLVNKDAQEALLEEDFEQLTIEKAYQKVIIIDRSKREAQIMSGGAGAQVNAVRTKTQKLVKQTCDQCGLEGHTRDKCRTKCYKCKKLGHVRANCRKPAVQTQFHRTINSAQNQRNGQRNQRYNKGRGYSTNTVEDDDGELYNLNFANVDCFDVINFCDIESLSNVEFDVHAKRYSAVSMCNNCV